MPLPPRRLRCSPFRFALPRRRRRHLRPRRRTRRRHHRSKPGSRIYSMRCRRPFPAPAGGGIPAGRACSAATAAMGGVHVIRPPYPAVVALPGSAGSGHPPAGGICRPAAGPTAPGRPYEPRTVTAADRRDGVEYGMGPGRVICSSGAHGHGLAARRDRQKSGPDAACSAATVDAVALSAPAASGDHQVFDRASRRDGQGPGAGEGMDPVIAVHGLGSA